MTEYCRKCDKVLFDLDQKFCMDCTDELDLENKENFKKALLEFPRRRHLDSLLFWSMLLVIVVSVLMMSLYFIRFMACDEFAE